MLFTHNKQKNISYVMPKQDIKISFCTTCKGRWDHLAQTLKNNINDNVDYPNVEFVVLTYGDMEAYEKLKINFPNEIVTGKLLIANYPGAIGFNFPHAKNLVHRIAAEHGRFAHEKKHILCSLDADNFTGKGFAQYVADYFEKKPKGFLCVDALVNHISSTFGKASKISTVSVGGRMAMRKEDFYKVSGFDENATKSWGPDDTILVRKMMVNSLNFLPDQIPPNF